MLPVAVSGRFVAYLGGSAAGERASGVASPAKAPPGRERGALEWEPLARVLGQTLTDHNKDSPAL
eukprot:6636662-Alexandrium_andersonii.AAC.1